MKFQIVLFVCFIACALAAPPTPPAASAAPVSEQDDFHAETLRLETENNGLDKYNFA